MKSNYKHLLVWTLALMSMMAVAAPIDSVAARNVALGFLASGNASSLQSHHSGLRLAHVKPSAFKSGSADYYVFTTDDNNGFIIIAGDDRAKQPLAYGHSSFDMNDVPCNLQWMLEQYAEQMEFLVAHPDVQTSSNAPNKPSAQQQTVPEMLTTKWGQQQPYWNQCPEVDGTPCVTGCVATTMAQVMNYWEFPAILPNLPTYTTQTLQLEIPALPATPVNWELMRNTYYEGNYSQAQGAEVAKLMRYCGQACNMDYKPSGSGTVDTKQLKAFQTFFYNKAATRLNRDDYSDEEWNALIQEDLFAGYPVVYSGHDATTSHNFIIDGFDGTMYHINWGWTGSFNGYFELDAMSAGSFKPANHSMLHGIHPGEHDAICDFVHDGIFYNILDSQSVEVTFMNQEYNSYNGNVIIPETVEHSGTTYTVRAIGSSAFMNSTNLISVTIPKTITSIGQKAFYSAGITAITIPDEVTSMGASAFRLCPNLISVTLSNQLKKISDYAFSACTKLADITLPASITSIGNDAFRNTHLSTIVIPDSVSSIGTSAFENCPYLSNVTLGVGLKSVGESAFCHCPMLTKLTIGSTLLTMDDYCFDDSPIDFIICRSLIPPTGSTNCFSSSVFQNALLEVPLSAEAHYHQTQPWQSFTHVSTYDANGYINSGDFSFLKTSASTVEVNGYTGHESDLVIPSTIADGGVTYTVNAIGWHAFMSNKMLQSVVIPNTVSTIGQSAFQDCAALLDVTFGGELEAMSDKVFMNCTSLQAIEIPQGVTTIGNSAFENCASLTTVTLNASLKSILGKAFKKCSHLSSIAFPEGLETIGTEAFMNAAVSQVVIPNSVTQIGASAFYNCASLTSATLGTSLSSLGESAFYYCRKLTELTIMSPLTMGDNAFYSTGLKNIYCNTPTPPTGTQSCFHSTIYNSAVVAVPTFAEADYKAASPWKYFKQIALTDDGSFFVDDLILYRTSDNTAKVIKSKGINENVTIPETVECDGVVYTVTDIGDNAFKNNTVLKTVVIPNSVITIGRSAFERCAALDSVVMGTAVESIGASGFKGCSALNAIMLPESLQTIGEQAFMNTALTSITLPDAVTSIGNSTFENCRSLASVTLGRSITKIGARAFVMCNSLASIEIPDKVTTIGDEAFSSTGISSIVIPNAVTSMGRFTFYNCKSLSSATLGSSLSGIGAYTFELCESLKSIEIPNNIVSIGDEAFRSTGLTGIEIPNSVTVMGMRVLANNDSLKHVKLGQGLKTIPSHAFASCRNLTKVEMGDRVETISSSAFFHCNSLDSISIPNTVLTMGPHAFYYCQQLTHVFITDLASWCAIYFSGSSAVPFQAKCHLYLNGQEVINCVLPEGVSRINNYAFYNCGYIQSVKLPSSMSWIDREAFAGCTSLSRIISKAVNPPTATSLNCFSNETYDYARLLVPEASMAKYGSTGIWSHFSTIESLENYLRNGDLNFDYETTIADINLIINAIIAGKTDSDLDVNGDGEVTVSDINAIIEMIIHPHSEGHSVY